MQDPDGVRAEFIVTNAGPRRGARRAGNYRVAFGHSTGGYTMEVDVALAES